MAQKLIDAFKLKNLRLPTLVAEPLLLEIHSSGERETRNSFMTLHSDEVFTSCVPESLIPFHFIDLHTCKNAGTRTWIIYVLKELKKFVASFKKYLKYSSFFLIYLLYGIATLFRLKPDKLQWTGHHIWSDSR